MVNPLKYPWDQLTEIGDFVILEGLKPAQIRVSAAKYFKRHFGEGARITAQPTPAGVYVALIWFSEGEAQEAKKMSRYSRIGRIREEEDPDSDIARYLVDAEDDEDPDEDIRQYLDD